MYLIRLGSLCNNACVFCAQHGEEHPAQPDLPGLVEEQIRGVPSSGVVAFVGGEPTVHEQLPHWIERAARQGASHIWVQTNGRRLAYAAYAKRLAEAGVDAVEISLHGPTAAIHDYHVSVQGAFAQTCRGVRHARAAGVSVVVSCVWTRSNYRNTLELVRLVRTLGATALRCRYPVREGKAALHAPRVLPPKQLIAPYAKRAKSYADAVGFSLTMDGIHSVASADLFVPYIADLRPSEASSVEPMEPPRATRQRRVIPGREEQRTKVERTGAALRDVFPSLFDGEKGHDHG